MVGYDHGFSPEGLAAVGARCPHACQRCSPQGASDAELLERCEDDPLYATNCYVGATRSGAQEDCLVDGKAIVSPYEHQLLLSRCPFSCKRCKMCGPGSFLEQKFNNVNNKTVISLQCLNCSAGRYSPSEDLVACIDCPALEISETIGAARCKRCPAGHDDVVNRTECRACPEGTKFSAQDEACKPCEPGHFSDSSGSTTRELCGKGKFSVAAGSRHCSPCPEGRTTSQSGTTSSTCICEAGSYGSSLRCWRGGQLRAIWK